MPTTNSYLNRKALRFSVPDRHASCPRAFTLVELAATIAVIALLLAVAFPALSYARHVARIATCETNLAFFGVQMQIYANDNADPSTHSDSDPGARRTDHDTQHRNRQHLCGRQPGDDSGPGRRRGQ